MYLWLMLLNHRSGLTSVYEVNTERNILFFGGGVVPVERRIRIFISCLLHSTKGYIDIIYVVITNLMFSRWISNWVQYHYKLKNCFEMNIFSWTILPSLFLPVCRPFCVTRRVLLLLLTSSMLLCVLRAAGFPVQAHRLLCADGECRSYSDAGPRRSAAADPDRPVDTGRE